MGRMNENGRENGRDSLSGQPDTHSWADETLPLGLRKELLDRELQNFIARKGRGQPVAAPRGADGETNAERPVSGGRGSERTS